jgi:hypothetical protein
MLSEDVKLLKNKPKGETVMSITPGGEVTKKEDDKPGRFEEFIDYAAMSRAQLMKAAKEKGHKVDVKMTKPDLLALLTN